MTTPSRSASPRPSIRRAERALTWTRRWGVSIASLVAGLLALFVFRRGLPHVRWIVGYLLLLWLLVGVTLQVRDALHASGRRTGRFVVTAAEYTIQSLYHGILLFLLPAYWASTTLSSLNAPFFGVLVVLIVLATFDPLYQAVVHPRPWLGLAFLVVSSFGALNVALPLVGVPPYLSLLVAAWMAVAVLTPAVRRWRRWPWRRALSVTASLAMVVTVLVAAGRVAIPPAPLFVARAAIARDMGGGEPVDVFEGPISAADLRAGGLVAFTAVYAPAGLRQPIAHVWRREGAVMSVIPLSPVYGGRQEGFRTYSRKATFPGDPVGRWTVDVVTASGQLIGRLRFRVTP